MKQLQQAGAAFFKLGCARGVAEILRGRIEGEAKIDDCDVDRDGLDDVLGFAAGLGAVREDAHGFEEFGEAIDPRILVPAGVGKEEIEAAAGEAIGGFVAGCAGTVAGRAG